MRLSIPLTSYERSVLSYRSGLNEYLTHYEWRYFITLTFSKEVTESTADAMLDSFLRRLHSWVFGKKSKKRLALVPFLEQNYYDGLHLHILLEDPSLRTGRGPAQTLRQTIQRIWETTDGPSGKITVSCPDGASWFEEVHAPGGAVSYCLKQMPYNSDVVRWQFVNLPESPSE